VTPRRASGVLVDRGRVLAGRRLGSGGRRRGFDLASALLYLPADGLERRQDALRQGSSRSPGRLLPHLRLDRTLAEVGVYGDLARPIAADCDREPARVLPGDLCAPLHPAGALVHIEVALGIEGTLLFPWVLKRRPDRPSRNAPGRGSFDGGVGHGGRYLGRLPTWESQANTSSA
jgi:hypothetical protein